MIPPIIIKWPPIRSVTAVLVITGAIGLTAAFLFLKIESTIREAAVMLLTLAWSSAAHIVRALFKAGEDQ